VDLRATDAVRRLFDEVSARPPSPRDPSIDGMLPSLVLEPDDDESCARALALCHEEELAVVPVGSGTRLELGNPPSRLDVHLSTGALEGIDDHVAGDLTAVVAAGTKIEDLQKELANAGQFLPIDPPLPSRATVGGVFALGEPGFRRRPGARTRDLLLGFEAVLADGTRVKSGGRVVKNVSGYELSKLFVGSAGTLAVMTRAFVRLRALPEEIQTIAAGFRRAERAGEAFHRLSLLPLPPEAAALANPTLSRELGFEEDWTLYLRVEGFREEVKAGIQSALEVLPRRSDVVPSAVWEKLRDFPLTPTGEKELLLRGQVAPARTSELAERWKDGGQLLAYPDSGLVFSLTEDPDALSHREEQARLTGGNVVIERAPTALKTGRDVFGELPEGFSLMRRIKEKLDPKGILSPGRFVGRL
jgi:glycolate oxidase FAD binding subunit